MLRVQEVQRRVLIAMDKLAQRGKMELEQQGHRASGRGIDSIEAVILGASLTEVTAAILANDYLVPVDTGVTAARIPFGGIGGGGTSAYIQGLLDWIGQIRPGLDEKEAKSFAFAIAHTHKEQGMPSQGSYAFSKNGRRTGWIQNGIVDNEEQLEQDLNLLSLLAESFDSVVLPMFQ